MAKDGMTTLYLDIPDRLAERVFVLARADGRPLNDEAIILLGKGARVAEQEHADG